MTEDARFEDAGGRPLYLGAMDPDDLAVLSALVQDAVLPATEIAWRPRERRLAFLLNRIRREEGRPRDPVERVQSVLVIENARGVSSQGVPRGDADTVLQILNVGFVPGEYGAGHVEVTLAGDGAIRAEVEALEVTLKDVTRPYAAPSGRMPHHPE
ncbi:DUF2948 family protein [Roseivivax isoporae]|uniref:DUF2948 domain-containing protein n=1 Tax=Roseivivax isoporae LMG 25204 TaxID=1449351 RepID=X7F330_9RHOB|nr:DUF2948 family protein [Roseivivax isoporae]ETX27133.1 hypothetical protein RISW2_16485 [Roseivivax isoporae LMG 25204]